MPNKLELKCFNCKERFKDQEFLAPVKQKGKMKICIICKSEYSPRISKQKTCGDFNCKRELKRRAALKFYYKNKGKTSPVENFS